MGKEYLTIYNSLPQAFFHLCTWVSLSLSLSVSRNPRFRGLILGSLWPLAYVPASPVPPGYQYRENALHPNSLRVPLTNRGTLSFPSHVKEWRQLVMTLERVLPGVQPGVKLAGLETSLTRSALCCCSPNHQGLAISCPWRIRGVAALPFFRKEPTGWCCCWLSPVKVHWQKPWEAFRRRMLTLITQRV